MDSDVVESQENSYENTEAKTTSDKPSRHDRITRLPLTRIKNIIKTDPDVTLASQESVLLIAKATEMFLHHFAKTSYSQTARGKRKTIKRQDVDLSVEALDAYAFLEVVGQLHRDQLMVCLRGQYLHDRSRLQQDMESVFKMNTECWIEETGQFGIRSHKLYIRRIKDATSVSAK